MFVLSEARIGFSVRSQRDFFGAVFSLVENAFVHFIFLLLKMQVARGIVLLAFSVAIAQVCYNIIT